MPVAQRYVAIGDSQTEGLLDADGRGGYRGWADRFADALAAENPHVQYANLAVRGRLLGAIRDEQLAPALALRPDLVTVMGGLNDLLRPGCDAAALASTLGDLLSAFAASGATVITNTFPDPAQIAPLFARLAPVVAAHNAAIRELAATHGALLVDFAARGVGTDARIWSPDRIHANPLGHALMAAAFADTAGLAGHASWTEPLPALDPPGTARRAVTEARWLATHVAPWIGRRLRGRSSGDGISAKRPRLVPVAPIFHLIDPAEWPAAGQYRPESLAREGFVHFSFADQVAATANRHYRDRVELVALEVEPMAVPGGIRVEDSYGSGTAFPHVYGPIPVTAAVARHPLGRSAAGDWTFDEGVNPAGAAAPASPDR